MRILSIALGFLGLSIFMVSASAQKAALNDSIDMRAEAAWQDALQVWEEYGKVSGYCFSCSTYVADRYVFLLIGLL